MPDTQPLVVATSPPIITLMQKILEDKGYRTGLASKLADEDRSQVRAILHAGEFSLTKEFLLSLPRLGLIACLSVGFDGIDVAWCRANGIEVTHAQNLNSEEVADFALGLVLASWRGIVAGDRMVRDGRWTVQNRLPSVRGLAGQKAGIVGLGHIGSAIARRLQVLGIIVSWWGPLEKPGSLWPRSASLLALARENEILIVACRATAENRKLISREIIEAVGPTGLIVNISRGSLIDEAALIAALQQGRLGSAALDVFEEEPTAADQWANVPNTLLAPHNAGNTTESIRRMTLQAFENLHLFLSGLPVMSPCRL